MDRFSPLRAPAERHCRSFSSECLPFAGAKGDDVTSLFPASYTVDDSSTPSPAYPHYTSKILQPSLSCIDSRAACCHIVDESNLSVAPFARGTGRGPVKKGLHAQNIAQFQICSLE